MTLLGTSGCGKSTTLKLINGLIRPTAGTIFFDGAPLDYARIYAARLQMGYVIQEGGLFPHLNVFKNISIMARMLKWDENRMAARVNALLDLVGLDADRFCEKFPSQLSGGEGQRVGVARALMLDPPCLLMDEPFGALDPITRRELQDDFKRLKKALGKTVVFVTHDVAEAFKLADRVAIMSQGKLLQCDAPEVVRKNPHSEFVARFVQ